MRPNQTILDRFWGLSEVNSEIRQAAVKGLVDNLKDQNEEIWLYCLERLLKGLASSRQASRLGFAVAFVEVLRHSDYFTFQSVLNAVDKNLSLTDSEDAKENTLGQVLALHSIVKSEKFNQDVKFSSEVTERFSKLIAQEKTFELICFEGLLTLSRSLNKVDFKESVWPHLKSLCKADLSDSTASAIWFLLELSKAHPHHLKKKISFSITSILSEDLKEPVATALIDSARTCPVQHPLVKSVFGIALEGDVKEFSSFWRNVVEDKILASNDLANKIFVIQIVVMLLTQFSLITEQIPIVLSEAVMRQFMKMLLHPKHSTSSRFVQLSAASLLEAILGYSEKLKASNEFNKQIEVLKAIFNVCNNFDRVTSTHLVSRIIRTLLPPATDFCFEHSSGLLTTTMVKLSTVEAAAILKEIPLLFDTSHDVECSEAKLKTLKLLANWSLHAVGGVLTGKNDEPMPVKLLLDSDQLKDVATAVFSTCVENFCFKMTKNHSFHLNRASLKVLGDIMAKFIKSCAKNEDSAVRPWKFTQKEQTICKKAMDTFKRLQKEGDVEDKTVGFQVLLIGACLACLFHQTVDAEFIQEVLTCFEKSDLSVVSDDPYWLDVLIDLILSVLAKPSRLMRNVIQVAFKFFVPFLNDTSLETVLKAIDPTQKETLGSEDEEEEEDLEEFRNGAESQSSQTSQSEQSGATDNDIEFDSASEAESSEEEEEVEDGEADPHLTDAVRKALGDAALGRSDDDEASGPELDDEAMMSLDKVLADAFKQNLRRKKTGKTAHQQEAINFRIRCFDILFLTVSTEKPNLIILLNILTPLISVADAAGKSKEMEKVFERCRTLIHIIVHMRKIEATEQSDIVLDKAKELITSTKHIANPFLQSDVGEAMAFLYRVSVNSLKSNTGVAKSSDAQKEFHGYISDCLKDFMADRQSPVPYRIISSLFQRFPVDFAKFLPDLVEFAFDDNIRCIRRTESFSLIEHFLNGRLVNEATEDSMKHWKKFIKKFGKSLKTYITTAVLSEESEDTVKPRYFAQLAMVLVKLVNVNWPSQFDLGVFATQDFVIECLVPFTSAKMWTKSKTWSKVVSVLSRIAKKPAHKVFGSIVTILQKKIDRMEESVSTEVVNGTTQIEDVKAPPAKKRKE